MPNTKYEFINLKGLNLVCPKHLKPIQYLRTEYKSEGSAIVEEFSMMCAHCVFEDAAGPWMDDGHYVNVTITNHRS